MKAISAPAVRKHPGAWPERKDRPDMSKVPVITSGPLAGSYVKWCVRCSHWLPLSAFYENARRPGKYLSQCRTCRADNTRRFRDAHRPPPVPPPPPKTEKVCGRCRQTLPLASFTLRGDGQGGPRSNCRDCRNALNQAYKQSHREQTCNAARAYYRKNKDAVKERIRRANVANPDKYRAIHSSWKKRNKDAVNASTHRRRARLSGNRGSWTDDEWQRLKACYDWRCLMCKRQEATDGITLCFDHVVPLALSGFNVISNGQPLCRSCNSRKHTKVLDLRKH